MAPKIVLITGGNTGIGYEVVKALLQSPHPYRVLMGSRSVERGESAVKRLKAQVPDTQSTVDVVQVDISSDESIDAALAAVQKTTDHIDVLINNAGLALDQKILTGELTRRQAWVQTYDVNVAGTEVLTHAFAPLLLQSADPRLLFLTSGTASLQQLAAAYYPGPAPSAAGWPKPVPPPLVPGGAVFPPPNAYRSSKAALNMQMLAWHWALQPDGVKVFSISPGFLATNLGRTGTQSASSSSTASTDQPQPGGMAELLTKMGAGHPSAGGQLIRRVIEGERDADAGRVVNAQGVMPF